MTEVDYALLDCKNDFERRIVSNLDLANYMAHRFRWTEADLDDLVQWARLGLTKAAKGYRPDLGVKFSSYACIAMERAIIYGLYGNSNHPKTKAKPDFIYSLEWVNSEGYTLKESIPDYNDCFDPILDRVVLENMMSDLTDKQKYVLTQRCVNGRTLVEVGNSLGVSREAIRQQEKKALEIMRSKAG